VAADEVQRDAWRDLGGAVVEAQAIFVERADGALYVVHVERAAEEGLAHAGAGAVGHLAGLQVERGLGEILHAAGVVPVHVGQHDVRHLRGIDAGL
jgi:hypothetical protein